VLSSAARQAADYDRLVEHYEPVLSFDEQVADSYDKHPRGDEDDAVAFLEGLAHGGPALELAIGTGRIALPLAARGIRVDGIDLSTAMVDKLRSKPGGAELSVTIGDFSEVPVEGTYRLVYVVYNTLFNLLTQDEQVRCFQNVADHLADDGSFVIEARVPNDFYRLRDHQYVDAEWVGVDKVGLDVARHDPVTQRLEENHVSLSRDGIGLNPIVMRYAWPSELDLMARIAGLRLQERWDGWRRQPFTSTGNCVSVYGP
jgi:SAM-dependent methyltransferase